MGMWVVGPTVTAKVHGVEGVSDGRPPVTTYLHFYRSRDKVENLHYSISRLVEGFHA
jgi:hypothetical protein